MTVPKFSTRVPDAPKEKTATSGASRRELLYIWVIVAAWAFVPELRRIVDWLVGSGSYPVINLIPLILMLPLFWQALKKRRYGAQMNFVIVAWLLAFGYALFVALASGALFGAFYDLALFCVPTLVGLWVINASLNRRQLFEILTTATLTIGTIVSVYGLYQFARPPDWDVLWVQNSGLSSIGTAAPFELRIFSTLNSPAALGAFLVFTILLSLHRVTTKRKQLLVPLLLCTFALGFSLVRSAYLAVALGTVIYTLCSTQRRQLIGLGSVFAAVILGVGLALPAVFGTDSGATNRLTSRLGTFGNVQHDSSTVQREQESADALHEVQDEPLGQGLGVIGTSARLTTSAQTNTLDNGYLSRWLEMGAVGFPSYLVAIFAALFFTLQRWASARRSGAPAEEIDLLATAIAAQVALIGDELSGDVHSQLGGVFFWFMVGFALKGPARELYTALPSTLHRRLASWAPSGKISPDRA